MRGRFTAISGCERNQEPDLQIAHGRSHSDYADTSLRQGRYRGLDVARHGHCGLRFPGRQQTQGRHGWMPLRHFTGFQRAQHRKSVIEPRYRLVYGLYLERYRMSLAGVALDALL